MLEESAAEGQHCFSRTNPVQFVVIGNSQENVPRGDELLLVVSGSIAS